jgi:hypothetical protein
MPLRLKAAGASFEHHSETTKVPGADSRKQSLFAQVNPVIDLTGTSMSK